MIRPAHVYRAYAPDGRLLYVGCTVNLLARMREHEAHSPWWPFHASVTVETFDSRHEAAIAEVDAIRSEHPRWNVKDRATNHPDGFISLGSGRFGAPWLRDEIKEWRAWLRRDRRAAA